jgi:hypothetical protein
LKGTPLEVSEAFFVVFRAGGPPYELPESVRYGDLTIFPVLVDIARPEESGSRAPQPRLITAEELSAAMAGTGTEEGDPDERPDCSGGC